MGGAAQQGGHARGCGNEREPHEDGARAVKEEPAKAEPVIVITDVPLESMASELFRSTRLDGCETGGCLYGRTKGNIVTITRATGPAERGKFRLKIDDVMSHNWEIEESVEVGLWHSHPNGDSRPSRADRMAWLSGFARCGKETKLGAYAALIFSDLDETTGSIPRCTGGYSTYAKTATRASATRR